MKQEYTKLEAIQFLVQNSMYQDEWTGAGMWVAVERVMAHKGKITEKFLDRLLLGADNF
jgi:hypothetical protein